MTGATQCYKANDVAVRAPASAAEWSACRMLVPEAFLRPAPPEAVLATCSSRGEVAGAAAFVRHGGAIHQFRIRVVRGWRRRGVGTLLLQSLTERDDAAIYASADASEGDAEPFLLARGFRCADRIVRVEGDLMLLRDRIFPIRERLLASGRVPPGVSLARPSAAAPERLAQLFADHIVPLRDFHAGYVMPLITDPRLSESPVLLVDGAVEGMVLYEFDAASGVGTVHGRVVSERYRGGWANTLLMAAAIDRGLVQGVRRLRFDQPESNPDTRKLSGRIHAETLGCTICFVRKGGAQ